MSFCKSITAVMAGVLAFSAQAQESEQNKLIEFMQESGVELIETIPVKQMQGLNLDMYLTSQGPIYYDNDKQVLFSGGSPKQLVDNNIVDMERGIKKMLLERIEGKIVAKAPNEHAKIAVVADITCSWCQKLHAEVPNYLDAGITVEFILHANSGLDSRAAKVMSAILKQSDPLKALDAAYAQQYVAADAKASDVMVNNAKIARMLGVTGTPVIILEDGTMIDRYIPSHIITEELGK